MINKVVGVLGLFVILAAAALGGGLGRELGDLTTGPFSRFFEPTPQEIEEYMIEGLETAAEILNRQVPMMVDDFTRMDSVTVGPGAMITYHYSLPGHTSQDWDETFQQEHEATVRQKTCAMEGMKPSLAARGESPSAFDERSILVAYVAPPSNPGGILGRRALSARRLARLGATPDFHHGLLAGP